VSGANGAGRSIRDAVFTVPCGAQPRSTQYASTSANVVASSSRSHLQAPT
jgi:hypothetical protein